MRHWIAGTLSVIGIIVSATVPAATAADAYPTRPVRMVVPFPAGGNVDVFARMLYSRVERILGQSIVIDNRGGANGMLGAGIVANATPDGHTLYLGQPVITISPNFKRKPPFDPITAFAPVWQIGTGPTMLTVHPALPVKSVKDLIAYAKTQPGGLRYGSSGPGTTNHFSGELLRVMSGMPLTHVPYRGAANVVVAAIQGEIHIAFLPLLAAIPHVKAGRLKGLAVTSAKRSRAVPDLPTVAETIPGYEVEAWYGIVVPAKTPPRIVQKLDAALKDVVQTPEVRERLASQGVEVDHLGPAPFAAMIRKDAVKWAKLVKEGGIVLE